MVTRTTALTAATFGILTLSTVTPAFAQDAKAILSKVNSAYGNMKSYQADMIMDMAGPQGKTKMTMTIMKSGEKMAMKMVTTGGGGGGMMGGNMSMVMDGVNMYMYMPTMNQYMKMPVDPSMKAMLKQQSSTPDQIMKMVQGGSVKKLADSTIEGKSTFVLEATDSKKPAQGKSKMYIDKATYRLKKIEGAAPTGGPMGGSGATILIRNEKINPTFPASTFVFTPPKGAKVMQNPMGGGGGAPKRP